MAIGFGKNSNKSRQESTQTQNTNQTSTFTPNAEYLGMVRGGLNNAMGLMGGYGVTGAPDVANYLNPYMDTISAGIQRQGQIAGNNNDAQAAAAGAFGGTGWGLLRGETQRAYADAEAQAQAGAYNTALGAAMQERQAGANYDLNALQAYLGGLGLLGNWGTQNTTGTGTTTGMQKGKSTGFSLTGSYGG